MSLERPLQRKEEHALGDGNCAYNAFILALTEPGVLDQIERYLVHQGRDPNIVFEQFIIKTAYLFHPQPYNFATIKKALLEARGRNKIMLQKQLAPVLRKLAIDLIEQEYRDGNREYLNGTQAGLIAAFRQYVKHRFNPNIPIDDDIFIEHDFIKRSFEKCVNYLMRHDNNEENLNHCVELLKKWWARKGHKRFLYEMRKNRICSGDMELARLAKYFHVPLNVVSQNVEYNIHPENIPHHPAPRALVLKNTGGHWNNMRAVRTDHSSTSRLSTTTPLSRIVPVPRVPEQPAIGPFELAQTYAENRRNTINCIQNKKIREKRFLSKKHWSNLVKKQSRLRRVDDVDPQKARTTLYSLSLFKNKDAEQNVYVNKDLQIELDRQLAVKLQLKKYQKYKQKRRR